MCSVERNELFSNLSGSEAAFDAAVLMKVLPKFHGSRGRLEAPLVSILAWCSNPDTPDEALIKSKLQQSDFDPALDALNQIDYCYPKTAERVKRMLATLFRTGFAAFG